MSERRACHVLGHSRSVHRYRSKRPTLDRDLAVRLHEIALVKPRRGYRYAWDQLRRQGTPTNVKRVHRLWKLSGLQVPKKTRKRRRITNPGENSTTRLAPTYRNHIWCYDFIFDATENGRPIKILPVLDEYTRECLALVAGRSLTSRHLVEVLDHLIEERGAPTFIRSDNGSEFIAGRVKAHLSSVQSETRYVDPGAPWQNSYAESFNSRLRDEVLTQEIFCSLPEAQALLEIWRHEYNHDRGHSSLGYLSPLEFAASLEEHALQPLQTPNPHASVLT